MINTDVLIKQLNSTPKKNQKEKILNQIIENFSGYIHKYAIFLNSGKFKKKDKDIFNLLYLLTPKKQDIHITVNIIQNVFSHYSFDELISELELLFLKCIQKYKKTENGPGFSGYIYNYFKFEIKQWFCYISKDILNNTKIISIEDIQYENSSSKQDIIHYQNICLTDIDILNNLEKYILYLSYGLDFTDKEISELINIHRVKINNIKNNARKKLKNSEMLMEDFRIL